MFQIGEGQGVVCYDREKNEVYFAQHVDEALLQSQIRGFRFISGGERSLQLYFFLTASLVYAEVDGQVSERVLLPCINSLFDFCRIDGSRCDYSVLFDTRRSVLLHPRCIIVCTVGWSEAGQSYVRCSCGRSRRDRQY